MKLYRSSKPAFNSVTDQEPDENHMYIPKHDEMLVLKQGKWTRETAAIRFTQIMKKRDLRQAGFIFYARGYYCLPVIYGAKSPTEYNKGKKK